MKEESGGSEHSNPSRAAIDLEDGRDELNLAEFPLAAIADRVPDDQKTLVFEDRIWDVGKAETITRRLTISASDKFGLPTSLDDEVILGLIQLTKQNKFTSRSVSFSRYQLIQILGWRHEGKSYDRLEKSLKRWLGVTLYYDKAWWDKDEQSWVDENFHILEQLTLYDRERRLRKLRLGQSELPLSTFTWNEVVFRSFKSGYLKSLDLKVYRQLEHATAKRMYRFLDKRFYHKQHWEFDLAEFAFEHIGLSRNYDTGQLKRRLQPAIEELEAIGFLESLPSSQRYVKMARGIWRIVFSKQATKALADPTTAVESELVAKLTSRGVTLSVAAKIVREQSEEVIESQIDSFDRRVASESGKKLQNPGGYLVKAIRENFSTPKLGGRGEAKITPKAAPKRRAVVTTPQSGESNVTAFMNRLTPTEREKLEADALLHASSVLRAGYERSLKDGGSALAAYRQMLLEQEVRRRLGENAAAA